MAAVTLNPFMCGRFVLKAPRAELVSHFGLDECADFVPRYNIPPGTDIPVIRQSPESKRVVHLLRWGLIPHWAKDSSIGAKLNNARSETVSDRPSFRDAYKRRRCLIPASGFYEWKAQGNFKQPYYISAASGAILAMGGLWESWKAPDGSILRTVCVLTTSPNALMESIHDRMPVIVSPEDWQSWLSGPPEAIAGMLVPYRNGELQAWPVNRRVSKTQADDADLIEPIEDFA